MENLRNRKNKVNEIPQNSQDEQKEFIKIVKDPSWLSYTLIVTCLAFVTRFWNLTHPSQVVFDEVHFGKFASYYLERTYYFDVHPPLGKLFLALVGYLAGYDGHYHFDKIGEDYIANNVPYFWLRALPCLCGSLVIPVCFLTLKEVGLSLKSCLFGALLLICDNALITQSRLILLDSMLMLFCLLSTFSWIKFYKLRFHPFSYLWWKWLSLTGIALGLAMGVKMVGLFVVAAVGIATLCDLWDLLDVKNGLSGAQFIKHFVARALCLICLPLILYLSFFYIHFAILTKSGPGDAFMSAQFQEELQGSDLTTLSTAIPYYSNITIMHKGSRAFLHSHFDRYPLRYPDDRISSQGQQVTAYPHQDLNNFWIVEPVDSTKYPSLGPHELTEEEINRNVRYVRQGDTVRLKHILTESYLLTHDVASPLTTTNMEVTTVKEPAASERYDETLWYFDLTSENDPEEKLKSKKHWIRIVNVHHEVALFSSQSSILPEWGFKQQEVNGNKKVTQKSNTWHVQDVQHERIVNGTEIDEEPDNQKQAVKRMSFLSKVFELQTLMISHNAGLTKSHPYSSSPITWPFVLRGISFWEQKEGMKQIYLLANPIAWWTCLVATFLYPAMWILDRILLQRGIDEFGVVVRKWWNRSIGYLWLTWALHWLPFFLMGRMLFLHHYLPAFIYSTMVCATVFEFIGRVLHQDVKRFKGRNLVPLSQWLVQPSGLIFAVFLGLLSSAILWSFYYFAPLTYGLGFFTKEELVRRKWLSTWDLQYS